MVKVTFSTGKYVSELEARMSKAGISQAELGRAMTPPVSPTQVTRWFTKNEDRRRTPSLETIERIEAAMAKLTKRKGKGA
jgi:hypothetical protein